MRRLFLLFLLVGMPEGIIAQQDAPSTAPRDGGVSQVLVSIYIPPRHNASFSAVVHTEWAKPLAGGGTSTVVNQRHVVRDRDGRIYQERWLLVPKNSEIKSMMNKIEISDPNEHTQYDCFLLGQFKGNCELNSYAGVEWREAAQPAGPMPGNRGYRTHEDLGVRYIEGIETVGTRDTSVINAGVMGNDRPLKTVREYWRSEQLGVNLVSIMSSPEVGTQTFTLTNIDVTEPDPRVFELPQGYQIHDSRSLEEKRLN